MNWRHDNIRLRRLEAESIYIMREAVAEFGNPVMLYSIGKDSSAMLHLAQKAFHPAKLPFPLLHVDTSRNDCFSRSDGGATWGRATGAH